MSEESSPAFRFYVQDFFLDNRVVPMEDDEIGVYLRLLGAAWKDGSIPADPDEIHGLLPRTKRRDFDRIWSRVGKCWSPHPSEPGRLVQKRLERERQKQRDNKERRTQAGRAGAAARHSGRIANAQQTHSGRTTDAMRSDSLSFSSSLSLASSETASQRAHVREGDDSVLDDDEIALPVSGRVARGPAFEFATWFVRAAVEAGILGEHVLLDVAGAAFRELPAAEPLVASYSVDELQCRSRRLFAKKADATNPLLKSCTIKTLAAHWDWFAEPKPTNGRRAPAATSGFPRYIPEEMR